MYIIPSNRFLPTPAEISDRQTVELLHSISLYTKCPGETALLNVFLIKIDQATQRCKALCWHTAARTVGTSRWPNAIIHVRTSRYCRTRIWKQEFAQAWEYVLWGLLSGELPINIQCLMMILDMVIVAISLQALERMELTQSCPRIESEFQS